MLGGVINKAWAESVCSSLAEQRATPLSPLCKEVAMNFPLCFKFKLLMPLLPAALIFAGGFVPFSNADAQALDKDQAGAGDAAVCPMGGQSCANMSEHGSTGMDRMKRSDMMLNSRNVFGWQLLSPQERTDHRGKMHAFKTVEECKAYVAEHHEKMKARAQKKGIELPEAKNNPCDHIVAQGKLKKSL